MMMKNSQVYCAGAHPLYRPLAHVDGKPAPSSQRLKQLGQYASSPGHRGYCYAELAAFFPSGGRSHR